jgi:hypothetical protein
MVLLRWLYLINAILLINHEIDSAYWQEWRLFKMRGGVSLFLLLHFPMLFLILYGLVAVWQNTAAGIYFSILLSMAGLGAFCIHMFFIKRGRDEFKTPVSVGILTASLIVSLAQMVVSLMIKYCSH